MEEDESKRMTESAMDQLKLAMIADLTVLMGRHSKALGGSRRMLAVLAVAIEMHACDIPGKKHQRRFLLELAGQIARLALDLDDD